MQIISRPLNKDNSFRKYVENEKWNFVFGYIIGLIIPITLPWTFMMFSGGVKNFRSKMGYLIYVLLYFVALTFPIYYLFDLVQAK